MSPALRAAQQSLIAQGYPLPRWGADGQWGEESRGAMQQWAAAHGLPCRTREQESAAAERLISVQAAIKAIAAPPLVLDVRGQHAGVALRSRNPWARIDTICLHQMACDDGTDTPGRWQRWRDLAAHWAVLRHGEAVWLYDPDTYVWHGNAWNRRSVGLEIEGWYAGVEGDLSPASFWVPEGKVSARRRTPMVLLPPQVEAAQQAIRLAVAIVAAHGGRVRYMAAHRQSLASRRSDPGELIWQQVALPMMRELDLATAPTLKGGRPIPEVWDPAQRGAAY